jgi:signal transduction histidine kinase/ActR/RegA family two-component response regulator
MKKLLHVSRDIYHSLAAAGVDSSLSRDQCKTILLTNQILLAAIAVNFFAFVFYFFSDLSLSSLVNMITAVIFMSGIYCNYRHEFRLARILCVLGINFYLIVISIVEGLGAGEWLFYFPTFVSIAFMVRISKDYSELVMTYALTILAAFFCMEFVPHDTGLQPIHGKALEHLYTSRLVIATLLTVYISVLILRVNRGNEKRILDEKRFSDSIYNTSLDGVFIINAGTRIIEDCNQRTIQLFEITDKKEIIGTALGSWFQKKDGETLIPHREIETGPWQSELTIRTKKGKLFYAYASAVAFTYRDIQYLKMSILDMTNLKSTEFELIKAKEKAESAAKMKTRFLSNMSHELRTPLNGIIGSSNLLLQEEYLPGQKLQLDILKYSSEHMLTLVNDILDHTKMEVGKMELAKTPLNMQLFATRVIKQFSQQAEVKGLEFKTQIDPELNIELLTDETRLHQVLSNLLSNAIKFTHQGSITFIAQKVMASSTTMSVQFVVEDTGIGIPENKRNEIFESFTQADLETTRKYGGTGLGLTIAKELLEVFNSELILKSHEGKGSRFDFTLELPINENRKVYVTGKTDKVLTSLTGVRILVAEDNEVNMAVIKRFLQKWGVTISEAENGKIALNLFSKGGYDLLLFDLEMPEMDGASALKEVRKVDRDVPIIAFTAAVYENMQIDLKEKGFTDFIQKPFRPDELHKKISSHVTAKRA